MSGDAGPGLAALWQLFLPGAVLPPGVAAGAVGAAAAVGLLAGLLIGKAAAGNNQAELNMLDSAARANQYENYLTALSFYNANSRAKVAPFTRDQWIGWRTMNGLEVLR